MRIHEFGLLLLATLCHVQTNWADEPNKPQKELTVSPETTRITGPLDSEGYVDYVAAIDQRASKGVTPENNFEVVLRNLLGPRDVPEGLREKYFQRLGVPIPKGPFYSEFLPKGDDAEYNRAFDGPWTTEENPRVAAWLKKANAQLDVASKGSKRTRYYMPYISGERVEGEENYPPMISMVIPSVGGQRSIARGLHMRVNLRVGQGDVDGAWEDVLAIYRISRLSGQGATLIENLVAIALDGIAFGAAKTVLQSADLTDEQAKRFLADLIQMPHLPTMAEKIDVTERYMGLDTVQFLAREKDLIRAIKMISELSAVEPKPPQRNGTRLVVFQKDDAPKPAAIVAANLINWDVVTITLNKWYDRTAEAASEKNYVKRRESFANLERDLGKLRVRIADRAKLNPQAFQDRKRDRNGEVMGEVLVALLLPAIGPATAAQFDAMARLEVMRLAFAAEVYGRDHGRYPEQLANLRPAYVNQIPNDPFSRKPIRVGATDQIFVIYSIGRNGKDDRGRGYEDRGENNTRQWDDISIRIKLH